LDGFSYLTVNMVIMIHDKDLQGVYPKMKWAKGALLLDYKCELTR